jgi:hypothetical protein
MIDKTVLSSLTEDSKNARLTLERAKAVAAAQCVSLNDLLDAASLHIVNRFEEGDVDFAEADITMNGLWALLFQQAGPDIVVSEVLQDIYEAFDQGEYYHSGDPAEIDPVEKYTKPMLKAALLKHRNDA